MTQTIQAAWRSESGPAPVAAPLRAVDTWRSEAVGDKLSITTRIGVRGDDPNLLGHFPDLAVFPGVFVIEALCQVMALAVPAGPEPLTLRTVRSVRFLAPLLDGDELTLTITAAPRPDGGWTASAEGHRLDGTKTVKVKADFAPGEAAHA